MSYLATRPRDTAESAGSRTLTVTNTPTAEGSSREQTPNAEAGPSAQQHAPRTVGVLKLRGGPRKPRVVWSEGTVDNEHMEKKKSKICCIYHKPRAFDESSSESGSDSDSSCDSHAHSHSPKRGKMKMKKRDPGPAGVQEDESSSESEGGAGDGSARPSKGKGGRRKPLDKANGPVNGDAGHLPAEGGKANKYDSQARAK